MNKWQSAKKKAVNGICGTEIKRDANGELMTLAFIIPQKNLEKSYEGDIVDQIAKLVYEELKSQYKSEKQRWEELNSKASTLFGLSGIIDTIIFGIFILIVSNTDFRTRILDSEHSCLIFSLMITGYISYIVATMVFLWSFRVQKYTPAPYIEDESVMDVLLAGESEVLKIREIFSRQYLNGYMHNHEKVKKMYDQIFVGTLFLSLAVILSFVLAAIILFCVVL